MVEAKEMYGRDRSFSEQLKRQLKNGFAEKNGKGWPKVKLRESWVRSADVENSHWGKPSDRLNVGRGGNAKSRWYLRLFLQ